MKQVPCHVFDFLGGIIYKSYNTHILPTPTSDRVLAILVILVRKETSVRTLWCSLLNVDCFRIKGLSEGQEKLCSLYTDHMIHVGRGARNGIGECQWQFRNHRWNCTTVQDTTVFGPVLSIRKNICFRFICHYSPLSPWEPLCFVWLWCNLIPS